MKVGTKIVLLLSLFGTVIAQDAAKIYDESVKAVGIVNDRRQTGVASGFFINSTTFVTNRHVTRILGKTRMIIRTKSGAEYSVKKIIGEYSDKDIAIVEIDGESLYYFKLASENEIKTGDKVFAIGNPVSMDAKVYDFNFTEGIINNITYEDILAPQLTISAKVIMHSATLNPGNSGGPLINDKGELIGINTFVKAGLANNMFFAVHLSELIEVLDENRIEYFTGQGQKNANPTKMPDSVKVSTKGSDSENKTPVNSKDSVIPLKSVGQNDPMQIILWFIVIAIPLIGIPIYLRTRSRAQYVPPPPPIKENVVPERFKPIRESNGAFLMVKGTRFEIPPKGLMIGREKTCDLILEDKSISRHHAQITFDGANYYVMDLDSKNGTLLNGSKIRRSLLNDADIISAGNYKISFYKK